MTVALKKGAIWGVMMMVMMGWGCTPRPDIVSTDKRPGETYSADEVRQMTVDQPFLVSGDYFRKREQDPSVKIDISAERADPSGTAEPERTASEPAAARKMATPATTVAAVAAPRSDIQTPAAGVLKIGVVPDPDNIPEKTGNRFLKNLPGVSRFYPVLIADQEKIGEVLAGTDCMRRKDLRCLAGALSVYPGVRMLVLVEKITLPEKLPGTAVARIGVVDTGILFRYPVMEVAAPVKTEADMDRAIAGMLNQVLAFSVGKGALIPWFCRSFSSEGGSGIFPQESSPA
ncbi:hypothetical protein DENIS_3434 [Desulfonema ishimotonii]|uniref:Lipoprotein n=1 Tax=Desulfonema ishimotonii TaxID=45657 RepID=A0A401FZP6_9BACT|nr:hypothetical protein [Desulfonema ishimotonii]GBC62462.1 hypothetical protein DENIS_3434 [Desulfonema ishimotonii]